MGSARTENWVPFFPFFFQRAGPMPIENSFTVTPHSRAAIKWPHSWAAMSRPNNRIARIIYIEKPFLRDC